MIFIFLLQIENKCQANSDTTAYELASYFAVLETCVAVEKNKSLDRYAASLFVGNKIERL